MREVEDRRAERMGGGWRRKEWRREEGEGVGVGG